VDLVPIIYLEIYQFSELHFHLQVY